MASHPNPLVALDQAQTFRTVLASQSADYGDLLALLSRHHELLDLILGYLRLYEAIGLGRISKRFRNAVMATFPDYDPFGDWKNLGYSNVTVDDPDRRIENLARLAYQELKARISHVLTTHSGFTQPCELLASLSGRYGLDQNCAATLTLKVGGAKIYETLLALNFPNANADKYVASLNDSSIVHCNGEHGLPFPNTSHLCNYDQSRPGGVARRHGEWRLVLKWLLAYPHIMDGDLQIDKFCCIFCAAQLHAMGLTSLISANSKQAFKALNWYNFAPVVMFFKSKRSQLWGDDIEAEFEMLTSPAKQRFLYLIAQHAASPDRKAILEIDTEDFAPVCQCGKRMTLWKRTLDEGKRETRFWKCPACATTETLKRKLDPPSTAPKSAPPPKKTKRECTRCGAELVSKRTWNGTSGWACPNFPKCKGCWSWT